MKSKQINFYITPEDYSDINAWCKQQRILFYSTETKKVNSIENNISQIFLTQQAFVENLQISTTEKGLKYFDIAHSYLLEFSKGGFYQSNDKVFHRGRLYFVKSYYSNHSLVLKSEEFNFWCEQIFKKFKKDFLLKYDIDRSYLYSKSAIEWIESNNAEQAVSGLHWFSNK